MFLALNQLLFLLPLMKTFGTVDAHMAVSFPDLEFVSGAYGTIRADMTPKRDLTNSAFVESFSSISLFWDLLYEQGADNIVRIETGTESISLFGINPTLILGFVYQGEVRRAVLTLIRTRMTFILTDERTAPLLPLFNVFTFIIITGIYLSMNETC